MKKAFLITAAIAAFALAGCPDPNGEQPLPLLKGSISVTFEMNDAEVTVSTKVKVDDTVTVVVKAITTGETVTEGLHYEWQRSLNQSGPFEKIEESEDDSQYTFTEDDLIHYIMAVVTRDGYDGSVNSPVLGLVAAKDSVDCTVIFKVANLPDTTISVSSNAPIPVNDRPENPTPPGGKVFEGWYTDGGILFNLESDFVTGNITLTARFRSYQVTFINDEEAPVVTDVVDGRVGKPADPDKEGFHFDGWFEANSDEEFNFDYGNITSDITLYAQWTPNFIATVSIDGLKKVGETVTVEVTTDGGATVPTDELDYQWERGTLEGGDFTSEAPITADSSYTLVTDDEGKYIQVTVKRNNYYGEQKSEGHFGPITPAGTPTYNVTFKDKEGQYLEVKQVSENTSVVMPHEPTRGGHRFGGWYEDEDFITTFDVDTPIMAPTTVWVKWIKTWTVTFVTDTDQTIEEQIIDNEQSARRPLNDPEKADAIFDYWYSGSDPATEYTFSEPVTGDIILYAKWIPIVVVKKIDFEDRAEFIRTSSADSPAPAPDNKQAYDFQRGGNNSNLNSWAVSTDQNHTEGGSKSFRWGNVTESGQRVKLDKIFTDDDVGRTFDISLWVYSETATSVRLGTFSVSNTTPETGNSTSARAQQPAATTVNAGDWTEVVWKDYEHTPAAVTALITQLGITMSTAGTFTLYIDDIVIKAIDNDKRRVTFTSSPVPDDTVTYNDPVQQPPQPIRAGYIFDGWYDDPEFDTPYIFTTPVTEYKAIYAKWTENRHTVTFNTNGGSPIGDVSVLDGGSVARPADPTKADSLFENWYSNEELTAVFNFSGTITSNTTVYAKWYTVMKRIIFDNLNNFKLTSSPTTAVALNSLEVYEFQRGGGTGPIYGDNTDGNNNNGISTGMNHTTADSGKSFKWSTVTQTTQRVKFDKAFSPADVGRTFKISVWMHSTAANTVRLSAMRLSGVIGYDGTLIVAQSDALPLTANGWAELTWNYTHENAEATQLVVGDFGGSPAFSTSSPRTFYIDDIVIAAEEIAETTEKTINFEVDSFVEGTDWQAVNWTNSAPSNPLAAALSTEQARSPSRSFKLSGRNGTGTDPRPAKSGGVKFYNVFPQDADNGMYNVSAWVYNPASGNWVYLAVYAPDSTAIVTRQISRVEPGWNKVELRGYKHTVNGNTQLGIAQPEDVGRLDAFYIDDIVVTKVTE